MDFQFPFDNADVIDYNWPIKEHGLPKGLQAGKI